MCLNTTKEPQLKFQCPPRSHHPWLNPGASQNPPSLKLAACPGAAGTFGATSAARDSAHNPFPKQHASAQMFCCCFAWQARCSQGRALQPAGVGDQGPSLVQGALWTLQESPRNHPTWGEQLLHTRKEQAGTPLHPYDLGTGLQSQGPPQCLKVWDLEVSSKFNLWQLQ